MLRLKWLSLEYGLILWESKVISFFEGGGRDGSIWTYFGFWGEMVHLGHLERVEGVDDCAGGGSNKSKIFSFQISRELASLHAL